MITHSLFDPEHGGRRSSDERGIRLYLSTTRSETKSPARLPVSKSASTSTLILGSCQGGGVSVTERKFDEVDVGREDRQSTCSPLLLIQSFL